MIRESIILTLRCDACRSPAWSYATREAGQAMDMAKRDGWLIANSGGVEYHVCPRCARKSHDH